MKSIEWIDRLITERKLPSDRQAALLLGMTAAAMSKHRNGKSATLDDECAVRLAEALGIDPLEVLADQHAEASRSEKLKGIWHQMALRTAVATFAICAVLPPISSEKAMAYSADKLSTVYYVK